MATVDFFEARGSRWEEALCRQLEAEHAAGRRAYVWASSEAHARALDDLIWTFRDDAFVPHGLWQGEATADEAITIGWKAGNPNAADCLVLVRDAQPGELTGYARVIDFAPVDHPALREAARRRFRTFREAGLTVSFHPAP
ncbi:MAG: DNA polymerase III subunit chi [Deltaproteobacteria bacterium]|nr:DNA polymerase III subunit chi [Deltaproteobacteria bacterium]